MARRKGKPRSPDYDVCLSFAGEERSYVEKVADRLRAKGIRVFYDQYEQAQLWGRDLYQHLDDVYQNAARYCVLFASKRYAEKLWTNHELRSAQARAIRENKEYILPARFDDTEIPGLRKTVGYVDLRKTAPEALTEMIATKLGGSRNANFFPPEPDRLFHRLRLRAARSTERAHSQAYDFFRALQRLSPDELKVVLYIFYYGCHGEIPEHIHLAMDFLRRASGFPRSKIVRLLSGMRSVGFFASLRDSPDGHDEYLGESEDVTLLWYCSLKQGGNLSRIARAVVRQAVDGYCEQCGLEALLRLDFSQLCTVTVKEHKHKAKRGRKRSSGKRRKA